MAPAACGFTPAIYARRVAHGGNITYWGDPEVKSSVDRPGAVQKASN